MIIKFMKNKTINISVFVINYMIINYDYTL